ncbi:MAG: MFS transporter [Deltaproteobacteria bacterium]|nr:MFS transporter [Deltaproteobacteria bacterium]
MRTRIFYGWWIVLSTSIICLLGFGTWLYSFGVFLKPMCAEFGWTRAMTAGAYSLRSIEGGVASPVVGWAVDRYGARVVIIIGAVISGLGFALMFFVESLLGFYVVYGVVLSIGMSAMLYIPAWTVIAKWFSRRLSLALGVLAVGAGLGGLVCAPAVAWLIIHYGWRAAFVVLGVTVWVVVIPLALVVRDRPEDKGLSPYGLPAAPSPEAQPSGSAPHEKQAPERQGAVDFTLRQALSTSAFWLLAAAFFCQGVAHSVVTVHTVPALTDAGISMEKAAFCMGFLTLVSIVGRLGFGYLGDYVTKRYLFMVSYGLMGSGLLVLMHAGDMAAVYFFVALFGVGFGGMVPLMPAIRTEYFGRRAIGKIQGFMNPVMMIAGAAGPILAGHLFDTTGTYRTSFLFTGLLMFVAIVVIFFARPAHLLPTKMGE